MAGTGAEARDLRGESIEEQNAENEEPRGAGIPDGSAIGEAVRIVYLGSLYRRLRSRLDKAQATVATAHAIARVVYRMLKYKVEYETINVNEYEKKYEEQQIKYMKKKAAKFGFQLVPV